MSYTLARNLRRTAALSQIIRSESSTSILTQEEYIFRPPIPHWSKIIKEAEKIVGYPTSFMNLRWLLSDEFANLAMHLRKVVDINHPIVKTAKTLLYNEHNNLQPWGLIILLLSKAAAPKDASLQSNTIVENQRILAELTEMIRTGHYVHRGLLNIPPKERDNSDTAMFANKIAILIGDYLLVTANGMLARLKNQDLSYLISTALRDLSEGEFFGHRDEQNMPLPGRPIAKLSDTYTIRSDTLPLEVLNTLGSPVREWTLRTMYNGGSLFGRGCQGALLLGDLSKKQQAEAFKFGSHLCLAWQAATELQKITSTKENYSLVSAPVLFALNNNQQLYSYIENTSNINDLDLDVFREEVLKTDAVEQTRQLYEDNAMEAMKYLETFGDSEPVNTIKRLIKTL